MGKYEEITSNLEIDIDRSIIKQAVISAVYGSSRKALYSKISKDKVDQLCEYIDIDHNNSFLDEDFVLEKKTVLKVVYVFSLWSQKYLFL